MRSLFLRLSRLAHRLRCLSLLGPVQHVSRPSWLTSLTEEVGAAIKEKRIAAAITLGGVGRQRATV